ncbi:protein phosphatase 2C domain-containing protein [Denitratisoma sp. agr-D3]
MSYRVHGDSRIGRRAVNQDRLAFRVRDDAQFLVVADGMGGHAHGEVAAQVAVDHMVDAFEHRPSSALAQPRDFLEQCFNGAHGAILRVAGLRGLGEVPRTTCVACLVLDGVAHWGHAGDARLYLLREGRILHRSRDHTRVQQLLDKGLIDAAAARQHPDRHRVYNCLGGAVPPQVALSAAIPLRPGDVLALCSDGVWDPAGDGALVRHLGTTAPEQGVPSLMDDAERRAGPRADNLSLIVLRWDGRKIRPPLAPKSHEANPAWAESEIPGIIRPSQN